MEESPIREAATPPNIQSMIEAMLAKFKESNQKVFKQLQTMQSHIDETISHQNQPPISRLEFGDQHLSQQEAQVTQSPGLNNPIYTGIGQTMSSTVRRGSGSQPINPTTPGQNKNQLPNRYPSQDAANPSIDLTMSGMEDDLNVTG